MILSAIERGYLEREYGKIGVQSPLMRSFCDEIVGKMQLVFSFSKNMSLIDFGCGKGYFLHHLERLGMEKLRGVDPCPELVSGSFSPFVCLGSFQDNNLESSSFDIGFTCHTLHHLPQRNPQFAVQEMIRVSRRFLVLVEINNTNIPMFLMSLWNRRVERSAAFYNRRKVQKLLEAVDGVEVVSSCHLNSGYISGNSFLHRLACRCGAPPYNLTVAAKR